MERWKNWPAIQRIEFTLLLILSMLFTSASGISSHAADSGSCGIYRSHPAGGMEIALTFDDGPHSVYTPEILDILKEENVKATFFIVGANANENPGLVERILAEGHEIGNHTFDHAFLTGKSSVDVRREIDSCEDEMFRHSEYQTHYLRPPGGIYDDVVEQICAQYGYSIILWSVDTRDWTGRSAEGIEKEILDHVKDGSIILMHDYIGTESHTAEALKRVIPELKKLGYSFVTVTELLQGE